MRDDLLAKEAKGVEYFVVRCRPDGTQQNCLLDPEGFVEFEKADAVSGRTDAELRAFFAHLLRRRLVRMRPAGEALIARVIALVVRRYGGGIVVTPHQAGALALLLDVPADELGAAPGDDPRILVAIARRHQRSTWRGASPLARGRRQRVPIERHQLSYTVGASFAAEQPAHSETPRQTRGLVAAASRPQRRMRALHRLRQDLAARDVVVGPVIRDLLFGPGARQHLGQFLPHAARVAQISSVGRQLVGIAGAADPDIDAAMAQNIERRHALRDM